MKAFVNISGIVCPLDQQNVDTDAIIPKQFLKSIKRSGFGPFLFDEWRYLDRGEPGMDCGKRKINEKFFLNRPRYKNAEILLTRANFGCGSSREHAPWAIADYGIQVIIAPSFADIFFSNCYNSGLLPIVLQDNIVDQLFKECEAEVGYRLDVDLNTQLVTTSSGQSHFFEITPHRKHSLLNGFDEIELTLERGKDDISEFERRHKVARPWLF